MSYIGYWVLGVLRVLANVLFIITIPIWVPLVCIIYGLYAIGKYGLGEVEE